MFSEILQNVREKNPLIHVITNFVTVNDCANIILAGGASPTMAHDIGEVEDITAISQALVLNMGTMGDRDAMVVAGKYANALRHPVVLDPVAAGASKLRREMAARLLKNVRFAVIRGNVSEIKALALGSTSTRGVDASSIDIVTESNLGEAVAMAKNLSRDTGAVVVITGPIDIVAEKDRAFVIRNGHPIMSRITGSGCMLTALIGAFCGANPDRPFEAAAAAVAVMGVCGELAQQKTEQAGAGTMTFHTHLIDCVSTFTPDMLEGAMKIEAR